MQKDIIKNESENLRASLRISEMLCAILESENRTLKAEIQAQMSARDELDSALCQARKELAQVTQERTALEERKKALLTASRAMRDSLKKLAES